MSNPLAAGEACLLCAFLGFARCVVDCGQRGGQAFLAGFLVTGHHELLLTVWAVLMWVLVVPGIPAVVKWQQRRQS